MAARCGGSSRHAVEMKSKERSCGCEPPQGLGVRVAGGCARRPGADHFRDDVQQNSIAQNHDHAGRSQTCPAAVCAQCSPTCCAQPQQQHLVRQAVAAPLMGVSATATAPFTERPQHSSLLHHPAEQGAPLMAAPTHQPRSLSAHSTAMEDTRRTVDGCAADGGLSVNKVLALSLARRGQSLHTGAWQQQQQQHWECAWIKVLALSLACRPD